MWRFLIGLLIGGAAGFGAAKLTGRRKYIVLFTMKKSPRRRFEFNFNNIEEAKETFDELNKKRKIKGSVITNNDMDAFKDYEKSHEAFGILFFSQNDEVDIEKLALGYMKTDKEGIKSAVYLEKTK